MLIGTQSKQIIVCLIKHSCSELENFLIFLYLMNIHVYI